MIAASTIGDLLRPAERGRARTYDIGLVAGGAAVVAISAQLGIGWPVPITAQTLVVPLVGALLGARRGARCLLMYVGAGLLGLPVFAHGRAGLAALAGPTGGYLLGFVAAAYLVGALAERGWDRRPATTVLAMAAGNLVIYACGLVWLWVLVHPVGRPLAGDGILAVGLYPFLIGDLIKIALAAVLLPGGWRLARHFGLERRVQTR
jgi:biotin transport system substrate-specific component